MRAALCFAGLIFAGLVACSDEVEVQDSGPSDLGVDAGPSDLGPTDRGVDQGFPDSSFADAEPADAADAGADGGPDATPDAGPADADAPDADDLDAGPDAGPDAGDAGPLPCDYLDLQINLVQCPGGFQYLRGFEDLNGNPNCPPYWELGGNQYSTAPAAVSGQGCNSACIYQASTSVSLIDPCGRRNGYIIFTANGCPDIYEFSDGIFPSVEAWEAQLNCGG
ncbi:MAG: hypothetical protein IPG45_37185 [Deltaproteobacteria bacterium]|jgi:hypothetical protein|nr:hypothetical protein [Deltaproteobacteria bacterium]